MQFNTSFDISSNVYISASRKFNLCLLSYMALYLYVYFHTPLLHPLSTASHQPASLHFALSTHHYYHHASFFSYSFITRYILNASNLHLTALTHPLQQGQCMRAMRECVRGLCQCVRDKVRDAAWRTAWRHRGPGQDVFFDEEILSMKRGGREEQRKDAVWENGISSELHSVCSSAPSLNTYWISH